MEASKIKAYVLCREHINYFSNAKKELKYNKLSQMKNCNPYEISHTLKYYSGLKSFKNEISQEDCDKYIMLFEEVKEKIDEIKSLFDISKNIKILRCKNCNRY